MYTILQIDWKQILLGDENWSFLLETLLRSAIMFIVIVSGLTFLGKRGVNQLSVFELVVIIGLGSAAGDPMFYKSVGILPAIIVFVTIIGLYLVVMRLIGLNNKIEHILEGKPVCLIIEGKFMIQNFKKEILAQDEFFAELRLAGVSHLGQVEQAIVETSGQVSIFFYSQDDIKYGLPILPKMLDNCVRSISKKAHYACIFCGETLVLEPKPKHTCPTCKKDKWVPATNHSRKN